MQFQKDSDSMITSIDFLHDFKEKHFFKEFRVLKFSN